MAWRTYEGSCFHSSTENIPYPRKIRCAMALFNLSLVDSSSARPPGFVQSLIRACTTGAAVDKYRRGLQLFSAGSGWELLIRTVSSRHERVADVRPNVCQLGGTNCSATAVGQLALNYTHASLQIVPKAPQLDGSEHWVYIQWLACQIHNSSSSTCRLGIMRSGQSIVSS